MRLVAATARSACQGAEEIVRTMEEDHGRGEDRPGGETGGELGGVQTRGTPEAALVGCRRMQTRGTPEAALGCREGCPPRGNRGGFALFPPPTGGGIVFFSSQCNRNTFLFILLPQHILQRVVDAFKLFENSFAP